MRKLLLAAVAAMAPVGALSADTRSKTHCLMQVARHEAMRADRCISATEAEHLGWLELFWASGGDSLEACGFRPSPNLASSVFNGAARYVVGVNDNPFFVGQARARAHLKALGVRLGDASLCAEIWRGFGPRGEKFPALLTR